MAIFNVIQLPFVRHSSGRWLVEHPSAPGAILAYCDTEDEARRFAAACGCLTLVTCRSCSGHGGSCKPCSGTGWVSGNTLASAPCDTKETP